MSQILFKYDKLFIKEMVLFCTHDQIEQNIKLMILNCKKKHNKKCRCAVRKETYTQVSIIAQQKEIKPSTMRYTNDR